MTISIQSVVYCLVLPITTGRVHRWPCEPPLACPARGATVCWFESPTQGSGGPQTKYYAGGQVGVALTFADLVMKVGFPLYHLETCKI